MANKSRFNATKHGIFATTLFNFTFLEGAEDDFKSIIKAFRNALRPADEFEEIQIDKLAFLHLRLARLYKAEWQVAPKLFERLSKVLDEFHQVTVTAYVEEGEEGQEVAFLRREPSPEILMRYESNIERQIGRTLDLLTKYRDAARSSNRVLEG